MCWEVMEMAWVEREKAVSYLDWDHRIRIASEKRYASNSLAAAMRYSSSSFSSVCIVSSSSSVEGGDGDDEGGDNSRRMARPATVSSSRVWAVSEMSGNVMDPEMPELVASHRLTILDGLE